MLVFGSETTEGTPEELDVVSRWKYHRWRLAQLFPSMKPSDFDAASDAPWWVNSFIDVKRHELQDCFSVLNAQNKAKKKPKTP